jgi:two-component system C4-dicarboxylate transport response regulator DctD
MSRSQASRHGGEGSRATGSRVPDRDRDRDRDRDNDLDRDRDRDRDQNKRLAPAARLPVVLVDDDDDLREVLAELLAEQGYEVLELGTAEEALSSPRLGEAGVVLSDVRMPGMGGEALLSELQERHPELPVVMLTAHGDVPMAVRCLREGAYDFLQKPFDETVLLAAVRRAMEHTVIRREHAELTARLARPALDDDGAYGMVGTSPAMRELYRQIQLVAPSEAPVLLRGETGSGKELVARAIHAQSPRSGGPFVAVNAGALPEGLLESELFGHSKGAFTGAVHKRAGRLASASRGTLLLDEVESLSPRAQVQLLRVLEDGLVMAVGADEARRVDIRLITASKENVAELVRKGILREDFFHRVVVLTVEVPPLRARREDIPLLVAHFLRRAARRANVEPPQVPDDALEALLGHRWPGNVRELQNTVERMFVTTRDGRVGSPSPTGEAVSKRLMSLPATPGLLRDALERTEQEVIQSALQAEQGRVAAAARRLGISRRALYQRLERYGIAPDEYR